MDPDTTVGINLYIIYYVLFILLFFGLNIGFLVYGRKIVSIMPNSTVKKVKAVSIKFVTKN